jgi:hypothetical protein
MIGRTFLNSILFKSINQNCTFTGAELMKSRIFLPFIWLSVLVLVVGLACNAVSGGAEDPTSPPQPTQLSPSTDLPPTDPPPTDPPPTDPPPTDPPAIPTNTPRPPKPTSEPDSPPASGGLSLASDLYVHPFGIYEFYPFVGWEITSEDDGSMWLEAPDFSGAVYFEVTNTGYELAPESFEWFVTARDENYFIQYDEFQEVDRQMNADDGIASVEKTLVFDEVPQKVDSIYSQHGQVIYVIDFWANANLYESYDPGFDEFFNGITVYSEDAAANQMIYGWLTDFYGPEDLFYIGVPESWYYEYTYEDFVAVDTFYSPDEHAIIENIVYDDGEEVSKSEAGAFALELLREFYAEDIRITDDQVQPDGSERLIWNSPSGEYTGWSYFETRGTTFLLFTLIYDNAYEDIYFDVLNDIVGTYDIP